MLRLRAGRDLDGEERSNLGQFFTPPAIAKFMAELARAERGYVRILDAGAGVGSLAAALVHELLGRKQRPERIEVTAYEVAPEVTKHLAAALALCGDECRSRDVEFTSEIRPVDFIQEGSSLLRGDLLGPRRREYDIAILNPPYRKIRVDSPERRWLQDAGLETSNLYTGFLYLAGELLASGGELIAITPRSFCNGPYFFPFRKAFLRSMAIDRLHVFDSRDRAFGADGVLQENVIMHATRGGSRRTVLVSSSSSPDEPDVAVRRAAYSEVVGREADGLFIHIVPDLMNKALAATMQRLRTTLDDLGVAVSTGRVVDFRAKEHLRREPGPATAPLIYPGHLADGRVRWPRPNFKKPNALADVAETESLMVPSATYVLVKRFSAKEEPRRVVAAVIHAGDVPGPKVGFENHLNYFHQNGRGLPKDLARGLAAFLNTTAVDSYFRQFNGHTQVNATDLRTLRYPAREELERIGRRIGDRVLSQDGLDEVVEEECSAMAAKGGGTPVKAQKRLDQALSVLRDLGVPREQQNVRSALTLLALLDLKPTTPWSEAANPLRGITEMMTYFAQEYGVEYAPNTRETVRRFTVHQFVDAGFVLKNPDKPDRPVNSPQAVYQIEAGALEVFKSFGTPEWNKRLAAYLKAVGTLQQLYAREREMERIPVHLPLGGEVTLSPGGQNELIKLIVEEFCPRFTPGGRVLYVGDADDKWACYDEQRMKGLGVVVDSHGKMPDVVIHHEKKNWLVLVEAVTSHGPVNAKRHRELKALFKGSKAGLVFVTAFQTRAAMVRYLNEISWETEVWAAESPTHLIHFNGERFLGPYES